MAEVSERVQEGRLLQACVLQVDILAASEGQTQTNCNRLEIFLEFYIRIDSLTFLQQLHHSTSSLSLLIPSSFINLRRALINKDTTILKPSYCSSAARSFTAATATQLDQRKVPADVRVCSFWPSTYT